MARTPFSELLRTLADGFGNPVRKQTRAQVDGFSYANYMQPAVMGTIEAGLKPLAARLGGNLNRSSYSPGRIGGNTGPQVHNNRWRVATGARPGFTVSARHDKKSATTLLLTGRATYPLASVAGIAAGLLFEAIWFPFMSTNWSALFGNGVFIVLFLVTTIFAYWLIVKVTNVVLIGLVGLGLAAGLAFFIFLMWGLIIGVFLGWLLVTKAGNATSGKVLRAELNRSLDGIAASVMALPAPSVVPAVPMAPFSPVAPYIHPPLPPAYGPPAYASAPAGQVAPGYYGAPPTMYPPPSPAFAYAPPSGTSGYAASPVPLFPCPTCGNLLPDGTPVCARCNTAITWQ